MKEYSYQCLYCDIVDSVVTFDVCHEKIPMANGKVGYACYSVSCSLDRENVCSEGGEHKECKCLIERAKKQAKEELFEI